MHATSGDLQGGMRKTAAVTMAYGVPSSDIVGGGCTALMARASTGSQWYMLMTGLMPLQNQRHVRRDPGVVDRPSRDATHAAWEASVLLADVTGCR